MDGLKAKQIERDYDSICKNCGYAKDVHSMLNYYCPLNDPYEMFTIKDFNSDSYFEFEPLGFD